MTWLLKAMSEGGSHMWKVCLTEHRGAHASMSPNKASQAVYTPYRREENPGLSVNSPLWKKYTARDVNSIRLPSHQIFRPT